MRKIDIGDYVYNAQTEEKGYVENIYPELNIAIVKTNSSVEKAKLDDLVVLRVPSEETEEPDTKKKNLLERIKGTFLRGSYD